MQLYFGPNLRYFFHDGNGNYRYRAPKDFVDFFKQKAVTSIHNVAFGIGESFFISYTDTAGQSGAWFDLEDHYPKLRSWLLLEGLSHDYAKVSVSLGLDGAFFAASNQGHRWRNIPEGLSDYYQKFTRVDQFLAKRVSTVDLGYDGAFLGIGVDNTWFWDLEDKYPHFSSLNLVTEIPKATTVTINPFAPDQHFAVFQDGSTHYCFPQEWAGDIASLFQTYAQQTVQARRPTVTAQRSRPVWQRFSTNSATHPGTPPVQQQQQHQPSTVNEAMHLANNAFDAYNNVTNAGGQSTTYGGGGGGGSGLDVNQAVATMQSSVDMLNNVASMSGQGMNLANQIASNGLMVGQVAGQFVGAAASCTVM
ncbi:hypothetical protein LTR85_007883 [Meristemomyces frigidus]|nr:hypothetical protein LTR85_007883 [Meristemomyces frigidus]